jgi:hypothetical protein
MTVKFLSKLQKVQRQMKFLLNFKQKSKMVMKKFKLI